MRDTILPLLGGISSFFPGIYTSPADISGAFQAVRDWPVVSNTKVVQKI
jgi:hypothetical protein